MYTEIEDSVKTFCDIASLKEEVNEKFFDYARNNCRVRTSCHVGNLILCYSCVHNNYATIQLSELVSNRFDVSMKYDQNK